MGLKELFARLEKSEAYKKFKAESPDAFLCAGFFILNLKTGSYDYNLDFKNDKQIFTFKIPEHEESQIIMTQEEILDTQKPLDKISLGINVDLENLLEIIEKALLDNAIKSKIEEVIAVLQIHDNQQIWNLTVMCEGFVILLIHINSETGNVIKFEKKNLLDFVKK